jgi:DNA topoisomerase-1
MSKTLIIVESPSKAQKIQEYVGNDYIVLASKGHITELAKGGHFGIGVDIENNFKPHYVLIPEKIHVLEELMEAAKKVDLILLASDPDREGYLIAHQVAQRLADFNKPIKRIIFNEIKKAAILKAINNAKDIDMNIVHSAEGRRILDRLVGFTASPFLMTYFGKKLSAGRVQSVVTRMIIDREREIETFIPETFFTIQVNLSLDNKDGFITKYSGRPTDQQTAEDFKKRLSNPDFIVSEVSALDETKSPQAPLITSTLQRLMSKDYGFSADKTMKAAQGLYEAGYITYIRTDSVRVSDESIVDARQWLSDNKHIVPKKPNVYKNKDSQADAHEAIRCVDINLLPHNNFAIIDPDEKLVYEVVWKYFVASQASPAIYKTLKITAHVVNDKKAEVKATGKALSSAGFLDILGIKDDSKIEIPLLKVGDVLYHFSKYPVKMEKKETQPPPRFSEDKLIKELVFKGIGRPATYADLLNKITSRNYVEKKGSVYHATTLGKKITDELIKFFTFMDYNYTAKLEKQLDLIEGGKLDYIDMLKKFYPAFKSEVNQAYFSHGGTLCPNCQAPMQNRVSKTGVAFVSCSNWQKCKIKNLISSPKEI